MLCGNLCLRQIIKVIPCQWPYHDKDKSLRHVDLGKRLGGGEESGVHGHGGCGNSLDAQGN